MNYIQNKYRKTYSPEFKLSIVKKYLSGEYSAKELSYQYNINDRLIRSWACKFQDKGILSLEEHRGCHGKHAGGRPKIKEESELERLRRENLRLKGENFLLKKLEEHLKKSET